MGDSSGGGPGGAEIKNLKDLIRNTKERYFELNTNDKRWPCPFCSIKSKTLIQCRLHINDCHPNIAKENRQEFFSQYEVSQDSLNAGQHENNLNKESVYCLECDFLAKNNHGLKIHMNKHKKNGNQNNRINIDLSNHQSHESQNLTLRNDTEKSSNLNKVSNLITFLKLLKANTRVLKRIPKAARMYAAQEYSKIIETCNDSNTSIDSWSKLFAFPYVSFKTVEKKRKSNANVSIATIVKRNLDFWVKIKDLQFDEFFEEIIKNIPRKIKVTKNHDSDLIRTKKVQSKLDDGDIRGAIKILSSNDAMAPMNINTYSRLLEKHPEPNINIVVDDSNIPEITSTSISETKIAILNFPNGSAGGIDSLRPQHMKDMISRENGEHGNKLLESLCVFSDMLLNGKVNPLIITILYGACLCAINKKDNSIRPIAIGCTLRRMVAKIACARVAEKLGIDLRPKQIGFGTAGGAEAGVHSARNFIKSKKLNTKVFIKLDIINAFNELERHPMLISAQEKCPELYLFLKQCYSTPSTLFYGDFEILSKRGCQQGDPCGPLLFCIAIQEMTNLLQSEFNLWYLDDGSLGGNPDIVLEDLKTVINKSAELGFKLNFSKCEMMILGQQNENESEEIFNYFNEIAPGIILKENEIDLLGAPLTDSGISLAIQSKIQKLKLMINRLKNLNAHQAYFLLRHSLTIPMITFILRTTPCWHAIQDLEEYDSTLKSSLEEIINCKMNMNAWKQSTLSVKYGGLGLRNVTNLCFSSFLGSIHSVADLIQIILPPYTPSSDNLISEAYQSWQLISQADILLPPNSNLQKNWDDAICEKIHKEIMDTASSDVDKARLLEISSKESSAWLNAFPCSSLGTLLDNQSFQISISLRLGLPISHPHKCVCGVETDKFGHHGLCCNKSAGRYSKHEVVNDLFKRALQTCNIPATRDPIGCSRSDGKKPDCLTLIPWKNGKPLVWDFTCADTLAKSYLKATSKKAGEAARKRENYKKEKYQHLEEYYHFVPIAIETLGSWGDEGRKLVDVIGKKLMESTGEKKSKSFLIQRISIAIQRGNSASILGTIPYSSGLEEIHYIK